MVTFVGAGPGAADLITVRGKEKLEQAGQVIYAGSLVNPQLLSYCKEGCRIFDSAKMTLEEVIARIEEAQEDGLDTVRLHTGDSSLYGAVREQMEELDKRGILYEVVPGVSSFCGAAASLQMEYTLPGVSQSVILTRMAGRTPVPERESLSSLASHQATMVLFLSAGMLDQVTEELEKGGYSPDTPAAIVYKATWPDEKQVICTVETLAQCAAREGINKTALIIVGEAVRPERYGRSKLYDPSFTTGYRKGTGKEEQ